jgi:hypothetical protein
MTSHFPEPTGSGLVGVTDLVRYMNGINLSDSQRSNVELLLRGTQEDLEDYLNRPVQPMQVREYLVTDAAGYANVRVSPVHKVLHAEPLEATQFPFLESAAFESTPLVLDESLEEPARVLDLWGAGAGDYRIVPGGFYVGVPDAWYAVEYIGGYNGYADDKIKVAIMRVVAREVERNNDVTMNLRAGNADKGTESDSRASGWSPPELAAFDRLRRRVIV